MLRISSRHRVGKGRYASRRPIAWPMIASTNGAIPIPRLDASAARALARGDADGRGDVQRDRAPSPQETPRRASWPSSSVGQCCRAGRWRPMAGIPLPHLGGSNSAASRPLTIAPVVESCGMGTCWPARVTRSASAFRAGPQGRRRTARTWAVGDRVYGGFVAPRAVDDALAAGERRCRNLNASVLPAFAACDAR